MKWNEDCNILKTVTIESAPQQLIPYGAGHPWEI
jgi:hypothetical protein